MNPSDHRKYKGVKKGEVRDHMTGLKLAFNNVAEQATIANVQNEDAQGYEENYDAAEEGGRTADVPRQVLTEADIRCILKAEADNHQTAIKEFEQVGRLDTIEPLRCNLD